MAPRPETPAGKSASGLYRMPPRDIDAERAVLGAIIMNPQSMDTAVDILNGEPRELFFEPAHQVLYKAMVALNGTGRPIDRVTLMSEIGPCKEMDAVNNEAYLAELVGAVPTSANIGHYATIVLEKALRRKLIDVCAGLTQDAYDEDTEIIELLDAAEKGVFALNEQQQTQRIYPLHEIVNQNVNRIWEQITSGGGITGIPTGFKHLDTKLSGLQPSDMIVVAARPSVGKTAFALNIAANVAQTGRSVLIFSLEMAKEQLVQRLLCMVGKVDSDRLRKGYLARDEFPKIQAAASILVENKIFIDESAGLTPFELRSKARRHASQYSLDLIIIDYMQLMSIAGRYENREREISKISREIKGLARELSVPIITLSQLSREAEKDDSGMPKLSHLRESGAIEQDADVVIIMARPPKSEQEERKNEIIVNVAKQRNGPTGHFELLFLNHIQRFETKESGRQYEQLPPEASFSNIPPEEASIPIMPAPYEEQEELLDDDEEEIPYT